MTETTFEIRIDKDMTEQEVKEFAAKAAAKIAELTGKPCNVLGVKVIK